MQTGPSLWRNRQTLRYCTTIKEKKAQIPLDGLALSLQHGDKGMSRSFVKAWATVATIMAMVCFAFIQPMPEMNRVTTSHNSEFSALSVPATGSLSETPLFVDTFFSGKTFTPYVTVAVAPTIQLGAPRSYRHMEALAWPVPPPRDPLIRPG